MREVRETKIYFSNGLINKQINKFSKGCNREISRHRNIKWKHDILVE